MLEVFSSQNRPILHQSQDSMQSDVLGKKQQQAALINVAENDIAAMDHLHDNMVLNNAILMKEPWRQSSL